MDSANSARQVLEQEHTSPLAMRPVIDPVLLFCVGIVAVALGTAYYATALQLVDQWSSNDMYSFGFAVPVIAAYLVWLRWNEVRATPVAPNYAVGIPALALGCTMLLVGRVSSTNVLAQLSLPVTIAAIVILVCGTRITRQLWFPLAYLFTMIPFWDFITSRLHAPFQLYSAAVGVGALRLLDLPVLHDGIYIHLPKITLEVADVCSGVNSLVAVLCVGMPAAYIYISRWRTRLLIVASAILIALLSNGVRVALVSVFAFYEMRGADGDVHGPFSLLRSMLISGIGYVVLFWLIGRFQDRGTKSSSSVGSSVPPVKTWWRSPQVAGVVGALVLIATAVLLARHTVTPAPLQASLAGFPDTIGRWSAQVGDEAGPGWRTIRFDDNLARTYALPDGSTVDLFLGYFESQSPGRELVGFEVSRLLPSETERWTAAAAVDARDAVTTVNSQRSHVTYWYVINGRALSNPVLAKCLLTWSALTSGKTNGAIIVARTKLRSPTESTDSVRSRIADFIAGVASATQVYLPA